MNVQDEMKKLFGKTADKPTIERPAALEQTYSRKQKLASAIGLILVPGAVVGNLVTDNAAPNYVSHKVVDTFEHFVNEMQLEDGRLNDLMNDGETNGVPAGALTQLGTFPESMNGELGSQVTHVVSAQEMGAAPVQPAGKE
jgi:hypothetical protein